MRRRSVALTLAALVIPSLSLFGVKTGCSGDVPSQSRTQSQVLEDNPEMSVLRQELVVYASRDSTGLVRGIDLDVAREIYFRATGDKIDYPPINFLQKLKEDELKKARDYFRDLYKEERK